MTTTTEQATPINLNPRTVVLWLTGPNNRHQHDNVTPQPFGSERAEEIERQARQKATHGSWCDQIDKVITPEEKAFVMAVWDAIPSGSSTFMDAFYAIKNGQIDTTNS